MKTRLGCVVSGLVLALAISSLAGCHRSSAPVASLAVTPETLRLGFPEFDELEITLTPERELPEGVEPRLFLHLLEEPGTVLRTFDHRPPGSWREGREIRYRTRLYQSALAEPLEPGHYVLSAGLYDAAGRRYALRTRGQLVARLEYAVAEIVVPPPAPQLPAVRFSEEWLSAEPGVDRQILSRRSLAGSGPGTLQLGPLQGPGEILLRVGFAEPPGGRLEILGGESIPKVRIRSSCGGHEAEISGGGMETMVPVPPTQAPVACDIRFVPNFEARWPEAAETKSVSVEIVAWRAGSEDE